MKITYGMKVLAKLEALRVATALLKGGSLDYEMSVNDPDLELKETLIDLTNLELDRLSKSLEKRAISHAVKHKLDPEFNTFNPERLF